MYTYECIYYIVQGEQIWWSIRFLSWLIWNDLWGADGSLFLWFWLSPVAYYGYILYYWWLWCAWSVQIRKVTQLTHDKTRELCFSAFWTVVEKRGHFLLDVTPQICLRYVGDRCVASRMYNVHLGKHCPFTFSVEQHFSLDTFFESIQTSVDHFVRYDLLVDIVALIMGDTCGVVTSK